MQSGEVRGAIFDLDDTILDNFSKDPLRNLHAKSGLAALHAIGHKYGIESLTTLTTEDRIEDYRQATNHSVAGGNWVTLLRHGLAEGPVDVTHPLIIELGAIKAELHDQILRENGAEILDASRFIRGLARVGLEQHMAIASASVRRHIDIFLEEMSDLKQYFPEERIQSEETTTHFKPHPEVFDKAFLSLNLPEKDRSYTLAFEDNARGIESAVRAGLFTCAITSVHDREHFLSQEYPPHLIADSYAEFADLLEIPMVD